MCFFCWSLIHDVFLCVFLFHSVFQFGVVFVFVFVSVFYSLSVLFFLVQRCFFDVLNVTIIYLMQ